MSLIQSPEVYLLENNLNYSIKLEFKNIDLSIINSIRRIMISELPNVGFNTTNINILENTSVLHNQFLSDRISLIPISLFDSSVLNIYSIWNEDDCIRSYYFKTKSAIPTFKIDIENNEETRTLFEETRPYDLELENNIILNVTSEDILFKEETSYSNVSDIRKFIKPDIISNFLINKYNINDKNQFILINKLKLNADGEGNKIHIEFTPNIGKGSTHPLYSAVGTVSLKSKQDLDNTDKVFNYKIDRLNEERKGKNLDDLNEEEKIQLKKEFNTLDAKRIIVTDANGRPNNFELNIESIGGLLPIQILHSSIQFLIISLLDINNCIHFNTKGYDINFLKLKIEDSDIMMDSMDIVIKNEGHTIGNILSCIIQKYFTGENALIKNLFSFSSYIQPHPLDTFIILRLNLNPNLDITKLINICKTTNCPENELYDILNDEKCSFISNLSKFIKIIKLFILKQIIYIIVKKLKYIENKVTNISNENKLLESVSNPNNIDYEIDLDTYNIKDIIEKDINDNPLLIAINKL